MDVETPIPKDNEVLIKVRAVSVNPLDWRLAPRGQRGAPNLRCTATITWSPARIENKDHVLSKYDVSPLECGGRGGIRTPGLLFAPMLLADTGPQGV
jgi:hypothetical protein